MLLKRDRRKRESRGETKGVGGMRERKQTPPALVHRFLPAAALLLLAALGGCVYGPAYPAYPAYSYYGYYGGPVVSGGVFVGGGWWGRPGWHGGWWGGGCCWR